VFIGDVQALEYPEMFDLRPVSSMVWLKALDTRVGGRQNIFDFGASSTARVIVCTAGVEDGKLGSGTRLSPLDVDQGQLPSQMVERRTQMESGFTYQDTPLEVRLPVDIDAKLIVGRLRVIFGGNSYGLQLPELEDSRVQRVEMFCCSVEFEPDAIEGVHMIHSMYAQERISIGIPANPEGPRNTRAYTGGIRADLGQGGEVGEGITDS
jgi:hypothetical protein